MLTDRITLPSAGSDPEDLLSSALGTIFPDDITNQHGDPSGTVEYNSPTYGTIKLSLADPKGEGNRRLFSHHLWNSGVQLAVLMEDGWTEINYDPGRGISSSDGGRVGVGEGDMVDFEVADHTVLELGAGTGLAGLVACLAGAQTTVITDYPAPEVLANISTNVSVNIPAAQRESCRVQGHEWGVLGAEADDTSGEQASNAQGGDVFVHEGKHHYSRILVADCLWMPWQHGNLARSIEWFLTDDGVAWVVAGFHTGRAKVASFFQGIERGFLTEPVEERIEDNYRRNRERERRDAERGDGAPADDGPRWQSGLVVEKLWERDADGNDRPWLPDRGVEDVTGRKRWLVIAVLRRKTEKELQSSS